MNLTASPMFNADYSEGLVHQVVTAYLSGARQGTKAQKTRAEVSGGGVKPWRQKGTGRARAGSIRSPLWRKGGVTFAAKPRSFQQKVNRKMYRKAISVIFSELVRSERLSVVTEFAIKEPKTKQLLAQLEHCKIGQNALIITEHFDEALALASRNVPHVDYLEATAINPVSLIAHDRVVITEAAIKKIEEIFGE